MLQGLSAINAHMELVGTHLWGLPWVSAIPSNFHLIVIDLNDCFFSILLYEEDCEKFTFFIPILNSSQPDERDEWTILSHGMANSPTFYQQYLYSILSPYFDKDNTLLYVYMDDLIIGQLKDSGLAPWVTTIVDILQQHGFKIAPNKIQKVFPFYVLGSQITLSQTKVNEPQLILSKAFTLSGLQNIYGEINWVRPWLPIETGRLDVLYELL